MAHSKCGNAHWHVSINVSVIEGEMVLQWVLLVFPDHQSCDPVTRGSVFRSCALMHPGDLQ